MSIYGGKPSYGAGISYFILPYFYTTTKTVFLRNQLIVIALTPLAVISLVAIGSAMEAKAKKEGKIK